MELVEPELPVEPLFVEPLVAALAIATPPPPRTPATASSAAAIFIDLILVSPSRELTDPVKLAELSRNYGEAENSPRSGLADRGGKVSPTGGHVGT